MFTGLIEETGTLRQVAASDKGKTLTIESSLAPLELGESIACNGTCLTVTAIHPDGFVADASKETLEKTTFGELTPGARLHLERSLTLGKRLGGHLVTGHVDGIGSMVDKTPIGEATKVTFEAPPALATFLAPKGSVCIDGVSLTVNGAQGTRFDVMLVPWTLHHTSFGQRPVGARVNLEVDILAKYVARLLGRPGVDGNPAGDETSETGRVTLDLLRDSGYL